MAFLGGSSSIQATTSTTDVHQHHHTISPLPPPPPSSSTSNHHNQQELKSFMASSSSSSQQPSSSKTHNNNHNLDLHHQHHQQHQQNMSILGMPMPMSFPMMQSPPSSSSSLPGTFNMKENTAGAYDLGDLDQALFLYLDGQQPADLHDHGQNQTTSTGGGMKPPTLNIFPSQPMHVDPSSKVVNSNVLGGGVQSISSGPKGPPPAYLTTTNNNNNNNNNKQKSNQSQAQAEPSKSIKREGNRKGPTSSSEQEGPKTPDPKTLRRLAQNREAARKSRLRKKAYVQQLESSRIRLAQLEQEIQRARTQGLYFGGGGGGDQGIPVGVSNISSDAAVFDLEYTRWLEEHHRLTCELRAAAQEHIPENELKMYVDNCLAHYDVVMNLKSMVSKSDVFHLVSGMWKTPAERCFMWIGGFRPSELVKIILHQIEPLTEQQLMEICGLQQSAHGTEEALSHGLEALNQSLSDVIASDTLSCPPNMANYMGQMALAMNKLSNMETFVRQADSLRQQTLHRVHQILTTRQAARCFLAIAEYFHRLRALSSLWLARPRQDQ